MKVNLWIGLFIVIVLVFTGCGKEGEVNNSKGGASEYNNDPVTLKLFSHSAGINTEQDVNDLFIKPVQAKYPNITVELIKATDVALDQLIPTGQIPDLIATSNYHMITPLEMGLGSDLRDFIKNHNIDLSKFEPQTINVINNYGKNGEFYGVPFSLNYGMVVYNQDIFDKFAVHYPTDNMTWNEMIDLARLVTKMDDGVQYVGIDPGPALALSRAYSAPLLDEKQEKAVLTNTAFQTIFSQAKRIFDIPGIVSPEARYSYGVGFFLKDKRLALYPYWLSAYTTQLTTSEQLGSTFNWDIVTYPTYEGRPGIGREVDFHLLMVPETSKNKEHAYRVIEVLASEEAQKQMNKGARFTALKDFELRKQFASDMKVYEGKNIEGIFKVSPAPLPPSSRYDVKIYGFLNEAMKSMIVDQADINTVLRIAEEQANQYIKEAHSQ